MAVPSFVLVISDMVIASTQALCFWFFPKALGVRAARQIPKSQIQQCFVGETAIIFLRNDVRYPQQPGGRQGPNAGHK